ncbi:type II toxin-antitoxin system VapC family toxin [Candidatus Poribacteria bacterium]|nr:type II toxin-antitoxin system VapC family toxin [Candidatus Poribacteria bacterium]MBT5531844.1 type II toxin-antitoxin system VapC family toxin [Candidatus Poribacteria bacterium]MBT5711381.1 type II toxin-antitoxin system VapC family toxin [Candidatus Poribacteria bacterium]MBT7101662.1 type II toxin-antitoxin system VapC family toxin [Candidatus Poribacteria bacterium]
METSSTTLDFAMSLARRHGLRGYDAVHLAACLEVNAIHIDEGADPVTLVSSDDELNAAAEAEGLAVLNPLD